MKKAPTKLMRLYIIAMILAITASTVAYAEKAETIRVGCVFTGGYREGGDGEYKTGLGYNYYQKIAYYTD